MPVVKTPHKPDVETLGAALEKLNARVNVMTRLFETLITRLTNTRSVKEANENLACTIAKGAERVEAAKRAAKIIRASKTRVSPSVVFVSFRQPTASERKFAGSLSAKAKAALSKNRG